LPSESDFKIKIQQIQFWLGSLQRSPEQLDWRGLLRERREWKRRESDGG